ncbi:hypothetical protein BH20ACI1_BH20ACI1_25560 [soil metagenome]
MKGEVTKLGKKFYEEQLKPILEPQENGKFVAIEPDSQEYFIATTAVEAIKKGNALFPEKILFLARIGFPTAHKIGGYGYRKRIG